MERNNSYNTYNINKRHNTFKNINNRKEFKKLVNKGKNEEEYNYKYQFSDIDIDNNGIIKKHIRYRGDSSTRKGENNCDDIIIDDYSKPFSKYVYSNRNTNHKWNNVFYKEISHKSKSMDDNDINKSNKPFESKKIFVSNIEKETNNRNNKRNFKKDYRRIIYSKDNENNMNNSNNLININNIKNKNYNAFNKDYSNQFENNNINNIEIRKNIIVNEDRTNNYNIRRVDKSKLNEEFLSKNNIHQRDKKIQTYKGNNQIDGNLNENNEKD